MVTISLVGNRYESNNKNIVIYPTEIFHQQYGTRTRYGFWTFQETYSIPINPALSSFWLHLMATTHYQGEDN